MGLFDVLQRTSDGYFDGNALLRQWNSVKENPQRKLTEFTENTRVSEFVEALKEEIVQGSLGEASPKLDIQVLIRSKCKSGKKGGRPIEQVWMHPYLFIKFAMWINPRFEVKVIKFVYDELIKYRNESGDAYKEMSRAIRKIVARPFLSTAIQNVAKAINHIVYGSHESGMRNKIGEELKTRELYEIERNIVMLIDNGFIDSYEKLILFLRKQWVDKWQPKSLMV